LFFLKKKLVSCNTKFFWMEECQSKTEQFPQEEGIGSLLECMPKLNMKVAPESVQVVEIPEIKDIQSPKERNKTCNCCYIDFSMETPGIVCQSDEHWFCGICIQKWFSGVVMNDFNPQTVFNCLSISESCCAKLNEKHVFQFLQKSQIDLITIKLIEASGCRVFNCVRCFSFFSVDAVDNGSWIDCHSCRQTHCTRCQKIYHGGTLCEVPQDAEEMKKIGASICPNPQCKSRRWVEVSTNCNRLTCPSCKSAWCAICNYNMSDSGYNHFCGAQHDEDPAKCKKKKCNHMCVFIGRRNPQTLLEFKKHKDVELEKKAKEDADLENRIKARIRQRKEVEDSEWEQRAKRNELKRKHEKDKKSLQELNDPYGIGLDLQVPPDFWEDVSVTKTKQTEDSKSLTEARHQDATIITIFDLQKKLETIMRTLEKRISDLPLTNQTKDGIRRQKKVIQYHTDMMFDMIINGCQHSSYIPNIPHPNH
jgi:hypothetical protein